MTWAQPIQPPGRGKGCRFFRHSLKLLRPQPERFGLPCGKARGFLKQEKRVIEKDRGRVARFTPHRAATQNASNGEKAAG